MSEEFETKLRILLSILIDTVILLIWALATWGVNSLVNSLDLEESIDTVVLNVFVWGFGISTICTTLFQLIKDVIRAGVTNWLDVQQECSSQLHVQRKPRRGGRCRKGAVDAGRHAIDVDGISRLRRRVPRTSRSSCRSGTRRATGAMSWSARPSRTKRSRRS